MYVYRFGVVCLFLLLGWPSIRSSGTLTVSAAAAASVECADRYLLYSVQSGEGFSLRRDAFVRMSIVALESRTRTRTRTPTHTHTHTPTAAYIVVLPPLSSRLSPHWNQGIQHKGIRHYDKNIPWKTLFDLDNITNQTGLKYIEYEDWLSSQRRSSDSASAHSGTQQAGAIVDRVFHLCHFHYNDAFFAAQNAARVANQLYPKSHHPKDQLFKPFRCMAGEKPPQEGFCSNPLPQVIPPPTSGHMASIHSNEYGPLRLADGASDSIVCGLSNLVPGVVLNLFEDHLATVAHSRPLCSMLITNAQLIYWPGRPHPRSIDPTDPAVVTHNARDRLLRAARLARPLRELAHLYIRHILAARPAVIDRVDVTFSGSDSLDSRFLSFHVRRGDFKYVHASVVPTMPHLVEQIRNKYKRESAAALNTDTHISSQLFVSSDMSAEEWNQLLALAAQAEARETLGIAIHRLDIEDALNQLRPHFSPSLLAYVAGVPSSAGVDVPPSFTPFHVLLLDQYICEQSLPLSGFLATRHSYVSEMIWNQRRAWGIEDPMKWEKETFEGTTNTNTNKLKEEL